MSRQAFASVVTAVALAVPAAAGELPSSSKVEASSADESQRRTSGTCPTFEVALDDTATYKHSVDSTSPSSSSFRDVDDCQDECTCSSTKPTSLNARLVQLVQTLDEEMDAVEGLIEAYEQKLDLIRDSRRKLSRMLGAAVDDTAPSSSLSMDAYRSLERSNKKREFEEENEVDDELDRELQTSSLAIVTPSTEDVVVHTAATKEDLSVASRFVQTKIVEVPGCEGPKVALNAAPCKPFLLTATKAVVGRESSSASPSSSSPPLSSLLTFREIVENTSALIQKSELSLSPAASLPLPNTASFFPMLGSENTCPRRFARHQVRTGHFFLSTPLGGEFGVGGIAQGFCMPSGVASSIGDSDLSDALVVAGESVELVGKASDFPRDCDDHDSTSNGRRCAVSITAATIVPSRGGKLLALSADDTGRLSAVNVRTGAFVFSRQMSGDLGGIGGILAGGTAKQTTFFYTASSLALVDVDALVASSSSAFGGGGEWGAGCPPLWSAMPVAASVHSSASGGRMRNLFAFAFKDGRISFFDVKRSGRHSLECEAERTFILRRPPKTKKRKTRFSAEQPPLTPVDICLRGEYLYVLSVAGGIGGADKDDDVYNSSTYFSIHQIISTATSSASSKSGGNSRKRGSWVLPPLLLKRPLSGNRSPSPQRKVEVGFEKQPRMQSPNVAPRVASRPFAAAAAASVGYSERNKDRYDTVDEDEDDDGDGDYGDGEESGGVRDIHWREIRNARGIEMDCAELPPFSASVASGHYSASGMIALTYARHLRSFSHDGGAATGVGDRAGDNDDDDTTDANTRIVDNFSVRIKMLKILHPSLSGTSGTDRGYKRGSSGGDGGGNSFLLSRLPRLLIPIPIIIFIAIHIFKRLNRQSLHRFEEIDRSENDLRRARRAHQLSGQLNPDLVPGHTGAERMGPPSSRGATAALSRELKELEVEEMSLPTKAGRLGMISDILFDARLRAAKEVRRRSPSSVQTKALRIATRQRIEQQQNCDKENRLTVTGKGQADVLPQSGEEGALTKNRDDETRRREDADCGNDSPLETVSENDETEEGGE